MGSRKELRLRLDGWLVLVLTLDRSSCCMYLAAAMLGTLAHVHLRGSIPSMVRFVATFLLFLATPA